MPGMLSTWDAGMPMLCRVRLFPPCTPHPGPGLMLTHRGLSRAAGGGGRGGGRGRRPRAGPPGGGMVGRRGLAWRRHRDPPGREETERMRIIESLRLEKTSEIIKSNRQPNTTMSAKPCPKVPHLHVF